MGKDKKDYKSKYSHVEGNNIQKVTGQLNTNDMLFQNAQKQFNEKIAHINRQYEE